MAAFTLVEVLVVVAILLVLAALSVMGIAKMQRRAAQVKSTSNLSALQIANGSYAMDNNGRYVSTFTQNEKGKTGGLWDRNPGFLDLYVGDNETTEGKSQESRVSPEHLDPIAYKAGAKGYNTLKASYGMVSKDNYKSGNKDVDSSYLLTELSSPSQTAAFVTAVNWLVQYGGRNSWDGVEGKVNAPRIAYRYNDKALVVYYDGHVGSITMEDMEALDRRGGKNNSFWKGNGGRP